MQNNSSSFLRGLQGSKKFCCFKVRTFDINIKRGAMEKGPSLFYSYSFLFAQCTVYTKKCTLLYFVEQYFIGKSMVFRVPPATSVMGYR